MTVISREVAEAVETRTGQRPTLQQRGVVPSTRSGRAPADWANTKQFESLKATEEDWVSFFDARPDVLHQILGDIYIVTTYDERKRETGKRLDGRRVMPRDANLDALDAMITPRYSTDSFELSVRELIGERSLRQFAARVPMDHRELSRMMRGESNPSMYWLEQIAASCRITPHFFLEYRVQFIAARLAQVFEAKPNLSIGVVKRMTTLPTSVRR